MRPELVPPAFQREVVEGLTAPATPRELLVLVAILVLVAAGLAVALRRPR